MKARERHYQARDTLAGRTLPAELLEIMDYSDEGAFASALDRLDEIMNQRLQQMVEARLRGRELPKTGDAGSGGLDVRTAFGLNRRSSQE